MQIKCNKILSKASAIKCQDLLKVNKTNKKICTSIIQQKTLSNADQMKLVFVKMYVQMKNLNVMDSDMVLAKSSIEDLSKIQLQIMIMSKYAITQNYNVNTQ